MNDGRIKKVGEWVLHRLMSGRVSSWEWGEVLHRWLGTNWI